MTTEGVLTLAWVAAVVAVSAAGSKHRRQP
jgi:hypothetical protein